MPKGTTMKEETMATLTIKEISQMKPKQIGNLIAWLENQVESIQKYHEEPGFAKTYRARLLK